MTLPELFVGVGAFLLMLGAGFVYVRADGRRRPLAPTLALAHLTGAAALGIGITLGLLVTDRVTPAAGAAGLVALAAAGLLRRGRLGSVPGAREAPLPDPPLLPGSPQRWVRPVLAALCLVGLGTAVLRLALLPVDWDGWMIWQLKAWAMTRGDLHRLLTTPDYAYAHPDYPLLVPGHVWWLCGGRFEPKVGQAAGFLFFVDLLVIFAYEARVRASGTAALAGCAVMLSWPPLLKHSASGFADVPMAAYCLACACAFADDDLWIGAPVLAGALLTKNEGLFTLAGVLLALVLVGRSRSGGPGCGRDARAPMRRWPAWARGLAVVAGVVLLTLGPWTAMKQRWGLSADLLDPSLWPVDLMSQIPQRVATIAVGFLRQAFAIGPWYPGWGLFWPVAIAAAAVSAVRKTSGVAGLWAIVAAHLAGTVAAYLITPADPTTHIETSIDRLALQVAPVALLAVLTVFFGREQDGR